MIHEAKVCLGTGITVVLLLLLVPPVLSWQMSNWIGPVLVSVFLIIFMRTMKKSDFEIAARSAFLSLVFTFGAYLVWSADTHIKSFGVYLCFLSMFHYSEYMAIAVCNPKTLSTDSFVINHSLHYTLAAVSSWIEFFVESHFFPGLKTIKLFWIVGAMICLAGEVLRKLAMVTTSSNFTHLVQYDRKPEHKLIRHGIYSVMRHPSYVGWFWWSIGTQIILANPICVVMYTLASWMFFKSRIHVEEITLINFFGHEYIKYKQEVPTGVPFIEGYVME